MMRRADARLVIDQKKGKTNERINPQFSPPGVNN
jgi:hypothetical protein